MTAVLAESGRLADRERARARQVDVYVLDVAVPGIDGLDVCERLRTQMRDETPVIFLTARDTLQDKKAGFARGADDYLVKPWRPFELLARLQVQLRSGRSQPAAPGEDEIEGWHFSAADQTVRRGTEEFRLPLKEFEVARMLFRHLGRPLSREPSGSWWM